MITIDLLKNHSEAIPRLAQLSYELIGKKWVSGASVERAIERFKLHLNEEILPFAFDPKIPAYYEKHGWIKIGMDEFQNKPVTVMEIKL